MTNNSQNKITIILNPCYEGIAFVAYESKNEILDFGIKIVKRKSLSDFAKKAEVLFEYCKPDIVFLLGGIRVSKRLNRAIEEIKLIAKDQNLQTQDFSIDSVNEFFEQYGVKTKYERSKLLISWFPMLGGIAPKEQFKFIKSDYHTPIFDVFALIVLHENRAD